MNGEKARLKEKLKARSTKAKALKNAKGITLLALVITIIVIIILSTVAISFAFGDNGLIKRAEDAKDYYANDTAYTEESITNAEAYLDETLATVIMVESADETPVLVPVPKGFTASSATEENTVAGGFVIYQGEEAVTNTNVEEAQRSRNQFVWIPVDDTSLAEMYNTTTPETVADTILAKSGLNEEITTTKLYSNLRLRSEDLSSNAGIPAEETKVREPDILTSATSGDATTTESRGINLLKSELGYSGTEAEILKNFAQDMVNEYEAVFNSIKKYGGFYIGRYELTGTTDNPTVQREKAVLTDESSGANTWYGLKDACNKIVSNDKVESIMIYGNQWDEVMYWLMETEAKNDSEINENSITWGNYSDSSESAAIEGAGSPQKSGFSDAWSANNIYDLAGNYWDWTQEANSASFRVIRRGTL